MSVITLKPGQLSTIPTEPGFRSSEACGF